MTRTFLAPDGTRWTVTVAPPSRHRKTPDPRVWLSFVSADGAKKLQTAAAGFDLEGATEAELLEVLELDRWGLLARKRSAPPTPDQG